MPRVTFRSFRHTLHLQYNAPITHCRTDQSNTITAAGFRKLAMLTTRNSLRDNTCLIMVLFDTWLLILNNNQKKHVKE